MAWYWFQPDDSGDIELTQSPPPGAVGPFQSRSDAASSADRALRADINSLRRSLTKLRKIREARGDE